MNQGDGDRVTISGHTYRIRPMPAKKALPIGQFVLRILGEALGNAKDLDSEIGAIIGRGLGAIRASELESKFSILMPYCDLVEPLSPEHMGEGLETESFTRVDTIFNTHFAGRLGAATLLLGYAIKANCGDFLDVLSDLPDMVGDGQKAKLSLAE